MSVHVRIDEPYVTLFYSVFIKTVRDHLECKINAIGVLFLICTAH